jgi:hypothetical protein
MDSAQAMPPLGTLALLALTLTLVVLAFIVGMRR